MSLDKVCKKCKTLDQSAFSKNNSSVCKDCDNSCRVCEKTKDETEFYGHNKSTCKSCCIKRNKLNRLTFKICPEMEDFCRKVGKDWDELCKQKKGKPNKNKSDRPTLSEDNIMHDDIHDDNHDDDQLSLHYKYEGLDSQFRELELDNGNLNDKYNQLENKYKDLEQLLIKAHERMEILENKLEQNYYDKSNTIRKIKDGMTDFTERFPDDIKTIIKANAEKVVK